MLADTSPDSKCPICLDRFNNVAYLDNCWHRFCFRCVQDRSKNKAECPLCKLPFISIFHTICADDNYQEYKVTPPEEAASSSFEGDYPTYSQKTAREGPSCRKRTHSEAQCSKKSVGPEFSIQPFTEVTDLHSQMGLHERQDSCYKQRRSRSPSSSRSRSPSAETNRTSSEKPGGKRKCKTRHLENAEKGSTSKKRKYSLKEILPIFSDPYKYKGSPSDNQESSKTGPKKKKKKMRSPSVESLQGKSSRHNDAS